MASWPWAWEEVTPSGTFLLLVIVAQSVRVLPPWGTLLIGANIFGKLGACDRAQAALIARDLGII